MVADRKKMLFFSALVSTIVFDEMIELGFVKDSFFILHLATTIYIIVRATMNDYWNGLSGQLFRLFFFLVGLHKKKKENNGGGGAAAFFKILIF